MVKYQIAFSNPEGVFPQKYEVYDTEKEAQEIVDKYNKQDNNPYGVWIVLKKEFK